MPRMTYYILDDQPSVSEIKEKLVRHPDFDLIGAGQDVHEGVSYFTSHGYPDVLFLSLDLPGSSFILNRQQILEQKVHLILTSTDHRKAIEGYDFFAAYFLAKPLDKTKFFAAVSLVLARRRKIEPRDYCFVSTGIKGQKLKVPYADISYLESNNNHVDIALVDGPVKTIRGSLRSLELQLPAQFVRINKSFIVNIDKIKFLTGEYIILSDEKELQIGAPYLEGLKSRLPTLG